MIKPKLIVLAGPNGAGKTSVTERLLEHEWVKDCVRINPDEIARDDFGDWNSLDAIQKAANKADQMREDCLSTRKSLIFETVLSTKEKLDYIARAKACGYFVRLFFVGTDSPTINAARIAQRVIEGGHDVTISKIVSRYGKSIANCAIAVSIVDRAYVYDNSVDFDAPRLLFRAVDGNVEKTYGEISAWAKEIFRNLKHA